MIALTREEAQQVLKVLEYPGPSWPESRTELAVVLRYKLSAPKPEPVAWRKKWEGETKWEYYEFDRYQGSEPLYTTPPQQSKSEPVAKLFGTLPVYETSVSLKDAVKQEPVAWVENLTDAQPHAVTDLKYCSVAQHERGEHLKYIPLYADATPCQTCVSLARAVMMDQTSHDTAPPQREWQGLTDEERESIASKAGYNPLTMTVYEYRVIIQKETEAKLREKNGNL
jgi:hypothetical protein